MMTFELSTLTILNILADLETAADTYESEANRTGLADIRRILKRRAKRSRSIAIHIKSRALDDSDFAREVKSAELLDLVRV